MAAVSRLPCFGLARPALPLTWLQKVPATVAPFAAFSSVRCQPVVINKVTMRGTYDLPDYFLVWLVFDLIDKVVVCSSAWRRIADHSPRTRGLLGYHLPPPIVALDSTD
jgi:hypothetical protein